MMLFDMHYSRDNAPPMKQKLCTRVDGSRICILEDMASSDRGDLMTWHLAASLMSDAIGNKADHLTPQLILPC